MSRRSLVASLLLVLVLGPGAAHQAFAQEAAGTRRLDLVATFANSEDAPAVTPGDQLPSFYRPVAEPFRKPKTSSSLLAGLYASTAIMQALDVHSTLSALSTGAVEGNPLMAGVSRNKGAFIAMKAGVAMSAIFAARGVARHNKVAAVATLVAINSAYAMVAHHNYQVARAGR